MAVPAKILNDLLKKACDANVAFTFREQFVLAKVSSVQSFYVGTSDDFDEEIKMTRANKNLMKSLDERGEQPKKGELIPMKEVEKRLGLKKLGRDS